MAAPILPIAAQPSIQEEAAHAVALKDGRTLVTWGEEAGGSFVPRLRARFVNAAGTAAAPAFTLVAKTKRGSVSFIPYPYDYSALQGKNGNIYVAWAEADDSQHLVSRISLRRFGLDGKQVGADAPVASRPNLYLVAQVAVVAVPNGNLVVIFHDLGTGRLLARVYDQNLKALSPAFALSPAGKSAGAFSVTPISTEGLAVAYYSSTPTTPLTIEGLTLSSNNAKVLSRFALTKDVGSNFGDRALDLISTGTGLFLGWDHYEDVVGQYFSLAGKPGAKISVPSTATCRQSEPRFVRLPNGAIAVLFDHWCEDDGIHQEGLVTIRGTKLSARLPVGHAKLSFYVSVGDLAVRSSTQVFAAWNEHIGGDSSVFGRAISPP